MPMSDSNFLNLVNQNISSAHQFIRNFNAGNTAAPAQDVGGPDTQLANIEPMMLMLMLQMMTTLMNQQYGSQPYGRNTLPSAPTSALPGYLQTMLPPGIGNYGLSGYNPSYNNAGYQNSGYPDNSPPDNSPIDPNPGNYGGNYGANNYASPAAPDLSQQYLPPRGYNPASPASSSDRQLAQDILQGYLNEDPALVLSESWRMAGLPQQLLGETLMQQFDKGDPAQTPQVAQLISQLISERQLNPLPFMREDYLSRLSDDQKSALSSSLADTGLSYANGQPNYRLMGYLISQADESNKPNQQQFAQDLLGQLSTNLPNYDNSVPVNTVLNSLGYQTNI